MGIFERFQPSPETPKEQKRLPTPEPLGARSLDTLPPVKSLKREGGREVPTYSPIYTKIRDFVVRKAEEAREKYKVPSPEYIKNYTERVKEEYTAHLRKLGVVNENEPIQWPEVTETLYGR